MCLLAWCSLLLLQLQDTPPPLSVHLLNRPTSVTAKVHAMHAAGSLSKLTIPELKAFLKSLPGKHALGGKKGELEERVRACLGGSAGAAAAAALVPAPAGGA